MEGFRVSHCGTEYNINRDSFEEWHPKYSVMFEDSISNVLILNNDFDSTSVKTFINFSQRKDLTIEEMNFLGMIFTLLGDTIITIAAQQSWQESLEPLIK